MVTAAIVLSLISMAYEDLSSNRQSKPLEETTATDKMVIKDIAVWQPLLAGVGSGIVIGATGVGGGVLLLPILTVLLQVDIKQAVGSSIVGLTH